MDDDFGTPEAMAALFELARQLNTVRAAGNAQQTIELATILKSLGAVLGILQADADVFLQAGSSDGLSAENIEQLIAERVQAKQNKQFARADQIRDELKAQGIILEDARSGTTWRRE